MKKLFVFITILILSLSIFAVPAVASSEGIDFDCVREKLLKGEDTSVCTGAGGGGTSGNIDTNFFGITFSPDQAGAARVVRTFITIALGALVIGAIFYGIYGIYVRSTAGTDENKMKESVSIFKNAVLAILITAGGLVLIQLLSIFLGLGNVWEFSFNGVGTAECTENDFKSDDTNPQCTRIYRCVNGTWTIQPGCL